MRVQQLECIPLAWIVACCQDNSSVGFFTGYGNLDSRGGGQTDVDDIDAATTQCAFYDRGCHLTRQTGVTADYDFQLPTWKFAFEPLGICRGKFNQIYRGKVFTGFSADCSADTGNGFDQSHVVMNFGVN